MNIQELKKNITTPTRMWLATEFIVLFGLIPVLLWAISVQGILFITLWAIAVFCIWIRRRQTGKTPRDAIHLWKPVRPEHQKVILSRFAAAVVLITIFTRCYDPLRLFEFPLERPNLWLMIMVCYPLLSVYPQEIIYRLFFFDRYAPIFPNERLMIIASGLAFGHAHIIFNNWVAYLMCIVGGWIFAYTYAKTKNFLLVWAEHSIYGCFIFTVGLGWYFYSGAAGMH